MCSVPSEAQLPVMPGSLLHRIGKFSVKISSHFGYREWSSSSVTLFFINTNKYLQGINITDKDTGIVL